MYRLLLDSDLDTGAINEFIESEADAWFQNLVTDYKDAAKKFVDRIRAKTKLEGSFGNITWNLRSSIGYLLIYAGETIDTYFPVLSTGAEGAAKGLAWAQEVANLINEHSGIQLIIVAGEEYAVFVEAKDIDVITHASKGFPAELLAEFKL